MARSENGATPVGVGRPAGRHPKHHVRPNVVQGELWKPGRPGSAWELTPQERELFGRFKREVGAQWTDGCGCQMCRWYDENESGARSYESYLNLALMWWLCYGGHAELANEGAPLGPSNVDRRPLQNDREAHRGREVGKLR